MTTERHGSTFCRLKDLTPLLRYLPTELQSMLPETGNSEWIGPDLTVHYSVTYGAGGGAKTLTLRLNIPISGTQPVASSSLSPTKQEAQVKTIDQRLRKLTEAELKQLLMRREYP